MEGPFSRCWVRCWPCSRVTELIWGSFRKWWEREGLNCDLAKDPGEPERFEYDHLKVTWANSLWLETGSTPEFEYVFLKSVLFQFNFRPRVRFPASNCYATSSKHLNPTKVRSRQKLVNFPNKIHCLLTAFDGARISHWLAPPRITFSKSRKKLREKPKWFVEKENLDRQIGRKPKRMGAPRRVAIQRIRNENEILTRKK